MVHGENRIPYWIDRRLNGLAGPEYHAIISFGLPIEPEDSQYGEYRIIFRVFWSLYSLCRFEALVFRELLRRKSGERHLVMT